MPIKLGNTEVRPKGIAAVYWGAKLVYQALIKAFISGTSPFSLLNAADANIKSILQYGKCEEENDSIVCNNGVLENVNGEIQTVGTSEVITLSASNVANQTASAVNLYSCCGIDDTQDIIKGEVVRRNNICIYDGTQEIGERYIGSKTNGSIVIYPKEEEFQGDMVNFQTEDKENVNWLGIDIIPTRNLRGFSTPYIPEDSPNLIPDVGPSISASAYIDYAGRVLGSEGISTYVSPYFKIKAGETYTVTCYGEWADVTQYSVAGVGKVYFGLYDSNRNLVAIKGVYPKNSITFTVPEGVSLCRSTQSMSYLASVQFEEGSVSTPSKLHSNICNVPIMAQAKVCINGKNIIDRNGMAYGRIKRSDGGVSATSSTSNKYTDYIRCHGEYLYIKGTNSSGNSAICTLWFYDINKIGIRGFRMKADIDNAVAYAIPDNAAFVRLSVPTNMLDTAIASFSPITNYEKYSGTTETYDWSSYAEDVSGGEYIAESTIGSEDGRITTTWVSYRADLYFSGMSLVSIDYDSETEVYTAKFSKEISDDKKGYDTTTVGDSNGFFSYGEWTNSTSPSTACNAYLETNLSTNKQSLYMVFRTKTEITDRNSVYNWITATILGSEWRRMPMVSYKLASPIVAYPPSS